MTAIEIHIVPAMSDNYIYVARDPQDGTTIVVDPGEASAVEAFLGKNGWTPTHILNTHHHGDHTGGNATLMRAHGCPLIAPSAEAKRIGGVDTAVSDGDRLSLGRIRIEVLSTPGHTNGHVSYVLPDAGAVFCGDALFVLGCGRMFEGRPPEMWAGLKRLRALPDATRIYCGHEYTLANARFATTIDPDNDALAKRYAALKDLRDKGEPTVPSTIGEEKATNPFLRADDPGLQESLGMAAADPATVFGEIRRRKDEA